jgi:hypothetical protein
MQSNLNNIQELFNKMTQDGFDTNKNLKWGFFFINSQKGGLEKVHNELKDHGYKLEKLEELDTKDWMLYVSKIETLTAEKLHRRNIAFNELAEFCEIDMYDGWDVEKLDQK